MSKNRIKLNICGTDYVIISDETEEYMRNIADEVSDEMDGILKTNVRVSVVMAAVLTALKYCDESKKYMSDADNLRTQIKDYLEESVNAKMQADEAKKEKLKLEKEIETLKGKIKEYEDILESETSIDESLKGVLDGIKIDNNEDEIINVELDENQRIINLFGEQG